jgi:hypothetical protein
MTITNAPLKAFEEVTLLHVPRWAAPLWLILWGSEYLLLQLLSQAEPPNSLYSAILPGPPETTQVWDSFREEESGLEPDPQLTPPPQGTPPFPLNGVAASRSSMEGWSPQGGAELGQATSQAA